MKPLWLAFLVCVSVMCAAWGEPVSMEAPAVYAERLAPLLTASSWLLSRPLTAEQDGADGVVLLNEEIQFIEENGHHWRVMHLLQKAVTESGAEELARYVSGFRKSTQRAHLVLAQTIQPDGRKIPVKPDAAFLQTPQRDAEDALYDDQSELVVVFPNVKAGSLTESIVAIEEEQVRIPGQLTVGFGFAAGWPVETRRCVLELPTEWAAKMRFTTIGSGLPEAQRLQMEGRTRWIWERHNLPVQRYEPQRATIWTTGPYLWANTLKDWSEFLAWYLPSVERTSRVEAPLKAAVEECLKGVTDRREIINKLAALVADDLRYVGLEFGRCDLEPHDVNAVWEHQYGDCKDKASLLAAMLGVKGIRAHLALVNTENAGAIEKRSTDYRQFNHVITAIEQPDGGWLFCDPTVPNLPAGILAPSDGDRDVLLVKAGETWLHTPPQPLGHRKFSFDAKVAPAGEISGWLTFKASGYLGAIYSQLEAHGTKQSLRDRLTRMLEGSWEGARVVDVKTQGLPVSSPTDYSVQAYFVVPANDAASLAFPFGVTLLPDLRVDQPRETDYPLRIEEIEVDGKFALPIGLAAGRLPAALNLDSRFAQSRARWESSEKSISVALSFRVKESRVPAADCAAFASLLGAAKNWLSKPLVLQPFEGGKSPGENQPADLLVDFPQMPSGEGQLALVEERFPIDGNSPLRRAALEKAIAYFPQDAVTRFNAGTQIAWLDLRQSKPADAIKRLKELLGAYRGSVSVEDAALGEYVLGMADEAQGATREALDIFTAMAGDAQLSTGRRAWANYRLTAMYLGFNPAWAIESARAGIALEAGNEPALLVLLARTLLGTGHENDLLGKGHIEDLQPDLEILKRRSVPLFSESVVALAQLARDSALTPAKLPQATSLVDLLEKLNVEDAANDESRNALTGARSQIARVGSWGAICEELKKLITDGLPKELDDLALPGIGKKREDFRTAIEAAIKEGGKSGATKALTYSLQALTFFEPDENFSELLWKAASNAAWKERTEKTTAISPILEKLLAFCAMTPADDEANIEAAFIHADALGRCQDLKKASSVLLELTERKSLPDTYLITAFERLGQNAIDRQDYQAALQAWQRLEKFTDFASTADPLLRAVLVHLESAQPEQALRVLEILRAMPEAKWKKSDASDQIGALLELSKDPQKARAWWEASARWWPAWLAIESKLGLPLPEGQLFIPVVTNLNALGQELGAATRGNNLPERLRILRQMAHAGRWSPYIAVELQNLGSYLGPLKMTELIGDFRRFAISLHENFATDDAVQRHNEAFWATIAYFDSGDIDHAQTVIDDFIQTPYQQDPVTFGMARLASMTSARSGKKMKEAAEFAEKTLQAADYHEGRAIGVLLLAELYSKMDRKDSELALIEREISKSDIQASADQAAALKERLDGLKGGTALGESLTEAVKAWTAAAQIPWFQFSRPHSLEDPIIGDLDEAMSSGSTLSPPEQLKLMALVAGAPSQPESRRLKAFHDLFWGAANVAPDAATAARWAETVAAQTRLPQRLRAASLFPFLSHAFQWNQPGMFKKLRLLPAAAFLEPEPAAAVAAWQRYFDTRGTAEIDRVKSAREILKAPLSKVNSAVLERIVRDLLKDDYFDSAKKLYDELGAIRSSGTLESEKSVLQLQLLKAINQGRKWAPIEHALTSAVWRHFPPDSVQRPAIFEDGEYGWHELIQGEADATNLALWLLKTNRYEHGSFRFWGGLIATLDSTEESRQVRIKLLSTALDSAADDEIRAAIFAVLPALMDSDSAPDRALIAGWQEPWRSRADAPRTAAAIRSNDSLIALRTGSAGNLNALITTSRENSLPRLRSRILRAALVSADVELVRQLLPHYSAGELMSRELIECALRAYRLLGMEDEAALALEKARGHVYQATLEAWTSGFAFPAIYAYDLARFLGEPSLIPEDLAKAFAASQAHPRYRLTLLAEESRLRGNWKEALLHSEQGLKEYPTFYSFYKIKGDALAQLNQNAAALVAFRSFTAIAHDDLEAADALEQIKSLLLTHSK